MSLGRQQARQESVWVARLEMPTSQGNPFYCIVLELEWFRFHFITIKLGGVYTSVTF